MNLIGKIATAGVVAAMGLGVGAAGASAGITLDPNPFHYTGEEESDQVFGTDLFNVVCQDATYTGNTANATPTRIPFHAEYGTCSVTIAGIPLTANVTTNSDWDLHYVSGDASGDVTANVDVTPSTVPGEPAVKIDVPDFDCSIDIDAQSGLSHVIARNVTPTAVTIDATVGDIAYESDCPLVDPTGVGSYTGQVLIPGITMTNAAT